MKVKTTRVKFSDDDLNNSKVKKSYQTAEKYADKSDKMKRKIITDEDKFTQRKAKLRHGTLEIANENIKTPSKMKRVIKTGAVTAVSSSVKKGLSQNKDENVGVDSARQSESMADSALRGAEHIHHNHKIKKYVKAEKLEKKADKANINALFEKQKADDLTSTNPFSRWQQKHAIKKEYAAAKAGKGATTTKEAASTAKKGTKKITDKVSSFVSKHSHTIWIILAFGLIFMILSGALSSCSVMFQGGSNMVVATSYTAEDEDIIGANDDYKAMEANLQSKINNIESTKPRYDEYQYHLDEINHNPYELTSYLTVKFEDYTRAEVQDTLKTLFNRQYDFSTREEIQIKTRKETRTGTRDVIDEETGEVRQEEYEYEVEVEYEYRILHVNLKNNGLGVVITGMGMSEDEAERYAVLLQIKGNRSYLFEDDIYSNSTGPYTDYDIPGEALTDEKFAKMIKEAEKYLGYPYVWGGSSPSTSFDCSGFVSWVINNSNNGWSVGRLTANGLMNICDIIPPSEAKPGDLIFFQGTYDTAGASHVGIYVGNGMMIHCGNPISYASIEVDYWQQHFYCFGRLP
ncbi:C40 family peptidase [Clostridium sp. C45]|uniref:C40 family peptidase n=1 Tax=Clostridium sp. 10cd* TaxID=3373596 RepID=UPI0037C108E1